MENIPFRIGHGYDVHRLVEGRKLIMGGVEIPYEKGLLGHSDADVLLHAVSDALLGALALGDIGKHFPDTDPAYAGTGGGKGEGTGLCRGQSGCHDPLPETKACTVYRSHAGKDRSSLRCFCGTG